MEFLRAIGPVFNFLLLALALILCLFGACGQGGSTAETSATAAFCPKLLVTRSRESSMVSSFII